jgi:hypothetical protein
LVHAKLDEGRDVRFSVERFRKPQEAAADRVACKRFFAVRYA